MICHVSCYFGPCLGYRHSSTFNRWQDHLKVPRLPESRHRGERPGLGRDVCVPGVCFQLCLPLWVSISLMLVFH